MKIDISNLPIERCPSGSVGVPINDSFSFFRFHNFVGVNVWSETQVFIVIWLLLLLTKTMLIVRSDQQ